MTNQPSQINSLLPPEMLHQVFWQLPPRELKNVVLVCRLWREVGEEPVLWAGVIPRVTRENMSTMPERLGSKRMRAVRELRVKLGVEVSEEVLEAVARHRRLRVVEMGCAKLSSVDPSLLASAVSRLEEVGMDRTELTVLQVEAIMTAIHGRDCPVKKLDISYNNLSTVDPRLLANTVKSLEEVGMVMAKLTFQQVEEIMSAIGAGDCFVKKMYISLNNLSSVDPRLLAIAVTRVEEVVVLMTELTARQVEAIMATLDAGGGLVKRLNISFNNLSTVDPALLARVVNRLEEVKMNKTELTVLQMETILTQSLLKTSLRKLEMFYHLDDSRIDEMLVARARLVIKQLY